MEFTIHGNIDNIVCDKNLMEITNKLDDGSWPKLILAEGVPGVVCLNQYKLVVLLKLRDKHVREAKTLYDLIYYDDPEEKKLIVKEIVKSNGKETLLLLEGYDELPAQIQRDKESILVKIISGNCLPKQLSLSLVDNRQVSSL